MTSQRLRELIAGGETLNVELNGEAKGPLNDRELVEEVVCLANRAEDSPARLLVGLENVGRITGARPRHEAGRTDPARLTALIASATRPSLTVGNRWCCSTWKSTGALPGAIRRTCAGSQPIKHTGYSHDSLTRGGLCATGTRKGLGMRAARKNNRARLSDYRARKCDR